MRFPSNHDFHAYSLNEQDVYSAGIIFAILLISLCIFAKFLVVEEKKLGWVVSLVNSGIMMSVGLVYVIVKCHDYFRMLTFDSSFEGRRIFHSVDTYQFWLAYGLA